MACDPSRIYLERKISPLRGGIFMAELQQSRFDLQRVVGVKSAVAQHVAGGDPRPSQVWRLIQMMT